MARPRTRQIEPDSIARRAALHFIATYQSKVGPRLGARCNCNPSCSEYGRQAFLKYGFLQATAKTVRRIVRCGRAGARGLSDQP